MSKIKLPAIDTEKGEVCFVCEKFPQLTVFQEREQNIYKETAGGERILVDMIPPKYINFKNHVYVTGDQKEIDFLRNCPSVTGANNTGICISEVSTTDIAKMEAKSRYESLAAKLGPEKMAEWLTQADSQVAVTADPIANTVDEQSPEDAAKAAVAAAEKAQSEGE